MSNELEKQNEENAAELEQGEANERRAFQSPVDIMEDENNYMVVADMPGLDPNRINIRLDQEMLVIEGDSEVDGLDPVLYRRVFRVVSGLDPEGVKADYKQGVLSVTLPKPASHKPRKITVTAG